MVMILGNLHQMRYFAVQARSGDFPSPALLVDSVKDPCVSSESESTFSV